jgi:hypothetical protein
VFTIARAETMTIVRTLTDTAPSIPELKPGGSRMSLRPPAPRRGDHEDDMPVAAITPAGTAHSSTCVVTGGSLEVGDSSTTAGADRLDDVVSPRACPSVVCFSGLRLPVSLDGIVSWP